MSLSNFPSMASVPNEVTEMLRALQLGIQEAIGDELEGVYLRGSLALGDFDPVTSDLDYLAVTNLPVSEEKFAVLSAFHSRLAKTSNKYAEQLEGAYIDRAALKRYRSAELHPTIERGGLLQWSGHSAIWVI